ncbi:unnamed protein product, partial [Phaeothamnion confervicola]
ARQRELEAAAAARIQEGLEREAVLEKRREQRYPAVAVTHGVLYTGFSSSLSWKHGTREKTLDTNVRQWNDHFRPKALPQHALQSFADRSDSPAPFPVSRLKFPKPSKNPSYAHGTATGCRQCRTGWPSPPPPPTARRRSS